MFKRELELALAEYKRINKDATMKEIVAFIEGWNAYEEQLYRNTIKDKDGL